MPEPSSDLLSRLWLHEPDTRALEAVRGIESLAPLIAGSAELSTAYTELFLLNVYPYGTVFTDSSGELNATSAGRTARRYEASGYSPPELFEVGAPDHAGLCLGFLGPLCGQGGGGPRVLFAPARLASRLLPGGRARALRASFLQSPRDIHACDALGKSLRVHRPSTGSAR